MVSCKSSYSEVYVQSRSNLKQIVQSWTGVLTSSCLWKLHPFFNHHRGKLFDFRAFRFVWKTSDEFRWRFAGGIPPCDPGLLGDNPRLCAPSCEHLFLPSQWWSEPLSNWLWFQWYVSLQIRLAYWGQEMPHSNLLQEAMDMYDYHSTCCTLFAFTLERGKNLKTTQSILIIILPQHFLKSGRSPKTPGKLCDASILAHSSTNAWSFSSEEAIRKLYQMHIKCHIIIRATVPDKDLADQLRADFWRSSWEA